MVKCLPGVAEALCLIPSTTGGREGGKRSKVTGHGNRLIPVSLALGKRKQDRWEFKARLATVSDCRRISKQTSKIF